MRFSVVVLFAASLVSAVPATKRHNDNEVPSCAEGCFAIAEADSATCTPKDVACLCLNKYYISEVSACIENACSSDDAKKAAEVGIKECEAAGINPENPFPECGVPCVEKIQSNQCNDSDDDTCFCTDNQYIQSVAWCFKDCCHGDDFDKAKFVGEARCRAAGVDISSYDGW